MTASYSRTHEVDILRMAALIGICLVNVPFMALPIDVVLSPPQGTLDRVAVFLVEALFQLKFFLLFSFLFGWGIAIQQASSIAKGLAFNAPYFKRLLGLLIIGIAHAILVFSGDILVLYGLLGILLWFTRHATNKTLLTIAAWMIPLSMLFLVMVAVAIEEMSADPSLLQAQSYSLGSGFFETILARLETWPSTLVFMVFLQGPLAFAAFLTGLAAGKSNFFFPNSQGLTWLKSKLPLLTLIALPLNILFALVMGQIIPETYELTALLGFMAIALGAPALSALYLYGVIRFAQVVTLPKIFVLAGQNSLSAYVFQGVLGGFCFAGYGLGWFNQLGQFALLGVSFTIALLSMLVVGGYAMMFGRGPIEPLLRRIVSA